MGQTMSSPDREIAGLSRSGKFWISEESKANYKILKAKGKDFRELLENFSKAYGVARKSGLLSRSEQRWFADIEDKAKFQLAKFLRELRQLAHEQSWPADYMAKFQRAPLQLIHGQVTRTQQEITDYTTADYLDTTGDQPCLVERLSLSDTDLKCALQKVVRCVLEAPTARDKSKRVVSGTDRVGSERDVEEEKGPTLCEPLSEGTTPLPSGDNQARDAIDQKQSIRPSTLLRLPYLEVVPGTNWVGSGRDVEDGKGPTLCEPLSEGTTPPPSVNQARDAIDQKQSIRSNTSLRTDVRAAASSSVDVFDAKQVVCTFSVSEEETVEVLFFHVEGMATLFGVGLKDCLVEIHQREEGVVKIRQVPQEVWLDRWSVSQRSNSSLVSLDCSNTVFGLTRRNAVQALSPAQAAEQEGVGLGGGKNDVKTGDVSNAPAISLPWTPGFWNNLFGSRSGHGGKVVPDATKEGGRAQDTTTSDGEQQGSQGRGLPQEDIATESGLQDRPLELTVKIYLDPDRNTLYNDASKTTMHRKATPDGNIRKFSDSETGGDVPVLGGLSIEPEITFKFQYDRGRKEMTTTLDTKFHNDSVLRIADDADKFGYYHDMLLSSLKCTHEWQVRLRDCEVKSSHGIRSGERKRSMRLSTTAGRAKGTDYRMRAGIGQCQAEARTSSKEENAIESSHNQELTSKLELDCLMGKNFCMQDVGGIEKLAFVACNSDPLEGNVVLRDVADKKSAGQTGIMEAVRVQIGGDWVIFGNNMSTYKFICKRNLHQQLRRNEEEGQPRGLLCGVTKSKRGETPAVSVTTLIQKFSTRLLVNHSFSHMRPLKIPSFIS